MAAMVEGHEVWPELEGIQAPACRHKSGSVIEPVAHAIHDLQVQDWGARTPGWPWR